jgi:SAM-dependent methyltransferase
VSETIADAIEHLVVRIAPQASERCLDLATGTGWTARRMKARGGGVVGIDIGAGVIDAARTLAPEMDFRVGDAEQLDFADGAFDVVTSTFGVMFVGRPEDAAREIARVCRKGGRVGLCTWPPDDTIEGLFKVMRPYMPPPPATPPSSPFEWGKPERLRQLLGEPFDLKFETGITTMRLPSGQDAWNLFVEGYGPTKALAASCSAERRRDLERDFIAYHDRFRTDLGVAMPREYLVTLGTRR